MEGRGQGKLGNECGNRIGAAPAADNEKTRQKKGKGRPKQTPAAATGNLRPKTEEKNDIERRRGTLSVANMEGRPRGKTHRERDGERTGKVKRVVLVILQAML